jgi:hypothetical protein
VSSLIGIWDKKNECFVETESQLFIWYDGKVYEVTADYAGCTCCTGAWLEKEDVSDRYEPRVRLEGVANGDLLTYVTQKLTNSGKAGVDIQRGITTSYDFETYPWAKNELNDTETIIIKINGGAKDRHNNFL